MEASGLGRAHVTRLFDSGLLHCALLCVFQALLLWRFWCHVDLNVWDEAYYLRQGQLLAHGRWSELNYAWSLPLASAYALLEKLEVALELRPDIISAASALVATVALWWALRRLLSAPTAFLAACWWAASSVALNLEFVDANSYFLGLSLVALCVGFAARGYPWLALVMLVLATLNRAEIGLWLLSAGVLRLVQGRGRMRGPWGWLYLGCGAALLGLSSYGWRSRARSWLAFCQHYEWAHPTAPPAAEVFGGSTSVTAAARSHPVAFVEHVAGNLADLPSALATLLFDVWSWVPWMGGSLAGLFGLFVVIGVVLRLTGRTATEKTSDREAWLLLWASLPVTAVALVLAVRPVLLVPMVPLLFCCLFRSASDGWRVVGVRVPFLRRLPAFVPVLAVLAALLAPPFRHLDERGTPQRDAVELLRSHATHQASLLAAQADVLLFYAGATAASTINPTAVGFEDEFGSSQLAHLVERFDPDLLLDTAILRRARGASAHVDSVLASGEWRLIEQRGEAAIYARRR